MPRDSPNPPRRPSTGPHLWGYVLMFVLIVIVWRAAEATGLRGDDQAYVGLVGVIIASLAATTVGEGTTHHLLADGRLLAALVVGIALGAVLTFALGVDGYIAAGLLTVGLLTFSHLSRNRPVRTSA